MFPSSSLRGRVARWPRAAGRTGRRVAVAVLATIGAAGCDQSASAPAVPSPAVGADPVVDVVTAPVVRGAILQAVSAPGSVVARRESRIGTEVTGRIQRVFVSEGDRVDAGAPLFQIDPTSYEMARRQAEAGLDLARAELKQIGADLARARALRRQDVVAQQELDRLTTALTVAQARERQAEEMVALAGHNQERTLVAAPFAGSVAARLADEGTTALVQPQTIVIVLQETGELEAHAAIPESQLALVQVGDRAVVTVEGLPEPLETAVSAVSDSIDPGTRTYLVKMPVPNPDRRLKAGVFAQVEIRPQAKADVLLVPREAVRTEDGRARLFVVRDGRAQPVPVEIGIVSDAQAEVLRGVEAGEQVLVGEAAREIAPGMRVRVVAAPAEAMS